MKRRVLFVIRPVAGGMREHLSLLAKHLDKEVFEAFAVVPNEDLLADRLRDAGVEPVVVPEIGSVNPLAALKGAAAIASICQTRGVDLIHSHGYRAALPAGIGAKKAGIPHVLTIHTELGSRKDSGLGGRGIKAIAAALSNRIIVVSSAIAGDFPKRKVRVVENGIELKPLRRPEGMNRGRIGVIARLSREKGVDLFLESASLLKNELPGVRFVIVGDGPLMEDLKGQASALGIDGIVDFLGFVDPARALLDTFDLLVLPSRSEGQPMVLLEALADGCPVIAADVGGVRALLGDNCGMIVKAEDPASIAEAVRVLLHEPERAAKMAEAGRRLVEERYSIDRMVDKTMAVYSEVLVEDRS